MKTGTKKQKFVKKNPYCCFCGGNVPSCSIDHVPPQACFSKGYFPEDFEFPACNECNQSSRELDAVFGFFSMAIDFEEANTDAERLAALYQGIQNNYPDRFPLNNLSASETRRALRSLGLSKPAGVFLSDIPLAKLNPNFVSAINSAIRKLSCALYYKETGRILPLGWKIFGSYDQIQNKNFNNFLQYFKDQLPVTFIAGRRNQKNYGSKFAY